LLDVIWSGDEHDSIYKLSGWSSTVKDSADVSGTDSWPTDVSRHSNGTDVVWCGNATDDLFQSSGFSATIRDSVDTSAITPAPSPYGICWDNFTDVTWTNVETGYLLAIKQSGFTSTVKDSFASPPGSGSRNPRGIQWFHGDNWMVDSVTKDLTWQSGFSATVKDSVDIQSIDTLMEGLGTNGGGDPYMSGLTNDLLYWLSGFSATLKDSLDTSATDNAPTGIDIDLYAWWVQPPSSLTTIFNKPRKQRNLVWYPSGVGYYTPWSVETSKPITVYNKPIRRKNIVWNPGVPLIDIGRHCMTARGRFRIAAGAEYRFYHSTTTTRPDDPFDTNATLPYSPTDTYGDGTHYFWMTYFNGFVESPPYPIGPNGEDYWRLDISGGVEIDSPPKAPAKWDLKAIAGGGVLVSGFYYEAGDLRADSWSMSVTFDGSDPTPGSDDYNVPIDGSGLEVLNYDEIPAQSHGTTIKVILQMKRGSSFSENTTDIKTITADAVGPTAPEAADAWRGAVPEA